MQDGNNTNGKAGGTQDNFFERLVRERNITVEQMKEIISDRIKQRLNDPNHEKRKSWEAIPCEGDIPTPEEWLKYAVEKLQMSGQGDLLKWLSDDYKYCR